MTAARLLKDYADQPGSVVKIMHDEDNIINLMFIQTAQQRELFKNFPELLQLDGT